MHHELTDDGRPATDYDQEYLDRQAALLDMIDAHELAAIGQPELDEIDASPTICLHETWENGACIDCGATAAGFWQYD